MRVAKGRSSYVGLGAALGVPQSALEAVTSLDPRDYQYGQPSAAQQQDAMQQLLHSSQCVQQGRPDTARPTRLQLARPRMMVEPTIGGGPLPPHLGAEARGGPPNDPSLALDLEEDCMKQLLGEEDAAGKRAPGNAGNAGRRAAGMLARTAGHGSWASGLTRAGTGAPHPSAAGAQQLHNVNADDDDDDDGDLLVSDVSTMRRVSSFTQLAHLPDIRVAAEGGSRAPGADPQAARLKLSMDYTAAAASINTALDLEHAAAKDSSGTRTPLLTCGAKAFSADVPAAAPAAAAAAAGAATAATKGTALKRQSSSKRRRP